MRFRLPACLPLLVLLSLACSGGTSGSGAGGGNADRQALVGLIDSIVSQPISDGKAAGAAIMVVKGNDTIAYQGFGKADLEWDVPMHHDAVFEIGSVTKQFTGAAIMQLVEQGKVDLDADITTYVDFPTKGRKIAVRQLLDHTSGIRGYTETPSLRARFRDDLPPDSILALVAKEPFDFEPGEQEVYNNSAFFLAGRIIEKVSGLTYADYLQQNFFDKLGMDRTSYCSVTKVVKQRAHGYEPDSAGLNVKGYISHSWPYAAGSLCSSVGDLLKWNRALHGGQVLGAEAYAELIRPGTLNDGTTLRYAKGLALTDLAGRRAIWHDGGINGFISLNRYLPDDSLHVIVLWNSANEGLDVGEAIIEAVLGKKVAEGQTFEGDLGQFAGEWHGVGRGQPMEMTVAVDSAGNLTTQIKGSKELDTLRYVGGDEFHVGQTRAILKFDRTNGVPSRLRFDMGYAYLFLTRK
jgi:CubicO group peptidase (beta-lactamase class C family)